MMSGEDQLLVVLCMNRSEEDSMVVEPVEAVIGPFENEGAVLNWMAAHAIQRDDPHYSVRRLSEVRLP